MNTKKEEAYTKYDVFGFVRENQNYLNVKTDTNEAALTIPNINKKTRSRNKTSSRISGLRYRRTTTAEKNRNTTSVLETREKKWIKMIQTWERTTTERKKKVRLFKRLRKGIPESVRRTAWALLGDVPNMMEYTHKGQYKKLLAEANNVGTIESEDKSSCSVVTKYVIERDLKRTYPTHCMFGQGQDESPSNLKLEENGSITNHNNMMAETLEDEEPDLLRSMGGIACLRRVLRAYSMYDKETGYCQGMNFIAAMFITYMAEEEAFWLLVFVLNKEPCNMRKSFGLEMTQSRQLLYVGSRLFSQFIPRLYNHFHAENVDISMFATQWVLTIYTSNFPFALVTRIWDCFLSEGWKIVYRVMLAILSINESHLLASNFEEILMFLKKIPDDIDVDNVIERAYKIPLKRKQVKRLMKEWNERELEQSNTF